MIAAPAVADALAAQRTAHARDPLAHFEFNSNQQRDYCRFLFAGVQTHLRSGGMFGKTRVGVAALIAMARGDESIGARPAPAQYAHLTPVAVPRVKQPSTWYVLTKSRDQQVDATQQAFEELLGSWPYRKSYVKGEPDGVIKTLYIKPRGCRSDSIRDWSRVRFRCESSADKSLPGGRINGALADEPPDMEAWREICARAKRDEELYLGICETPLKREDWEELRAHFEGCIGKVLHNRIELRARIDENRFLSKAQLDQVRERWRDWSVPEAEDFQFHARWNGDYVDVTNRCPLDLVALARWESLCSPGHPINVLVRSSEDRDDGRHFVTRGAIYEQWVPYEEQEQYFVILEPSQGVADNKHDPAGGWVVARRRPRMVARFNGYLPPHGLGYLGGVWSKHYGDCPVDFENNKYGGEILYGLREAGCTNILQEVHETRLGAMDARLGFFTSQTSRAQLVAAAEDAIATDAIRVWSSAAVSSLQGVVEDRVTGKIQAGHGRHDEDLICLGRAALLLRRFPVSPEPEPDLWTPERVMNAALGIPEGRKNGARLRWR